LYSQRSPGRAEHLGRHPEAERERQQVAGGDRSLGGHGLVQRPVGSLENTAPGQLGKQRLDRLVEPDQAVVDERHRDRRGDRLARGGDPEQRVALYMVAHRHERDQPDDVRVPRCLSAALRTASRLTG
jgi:hypothetical protein